MENKDKTPDAAEHSSAKVDMGNVDTDRFEPFRVQWKNTVKTESIGKGGQMVMTYKPSHSKLSSISEYGRCYLLCEGILAVL